MLRWGGEGLAVVVGWPVRWDTEHSGTTEGRGGEEGRAPPGRGTGSSRVRGGRDRGLGGCC